MLNKLKNQEVEWLKTFLYQQGTNTKCFDIAVKYSELLDSKRINHTFIIEDDGNYIEISATDGLPQNVEFDIIVNGVKTTLVTDEKNAIMDDMCNLDSINLLLDKLLNIDHAVIV